MLLVAVTGGIGSGKSTVASRFAALGAMVVSADELARGAIAPGTPGAAAVIDRFGAAVMGESGGVDREQLAAIVFHDPEARADLEAIVHPIVRREWVAALATAASDAVVVYDVPLLAEVDGAGEFDAVVVVEADLDVRLSRLMGRGLTAEQARARMAAQASDDSRRALADYVIDNSGDRAALEAQVRDVWARLMKDAGDPR